MIYQFTNLATGEVGQVEADLLRIPGGISGCGPDEFIVRERETGENLGDSAPTKSEALENGCFTDIPNNRWGWMDVARLGPYS